MEEKAFYSDLKGTVELITFGSESLGLLKREQEYLGSVLFTTDLSTVSLPVPSKYAQENRIELYFLLPDYWPLETSSSLFAWAAETLIEIKNYLKAGHWAITGHTFKMPTPPEGKFKEAGFDALLLMNPILVKESLAPIPCKDKVIHFKALCPIFKREKDVKEARGMEKFMERYLAKGNTEKLDEFRVSSVKTSLLFWR